jgi:tetratricopeptide (TPR) repeat protein
LTCCKLDPTSLPSRQALRAVSRSLAEQGRRPGALGSLLTRARFAAARRRGDRRKVLEYGEELLLRDPDDIATQMVMAEAAGELGLTSVAFWMLEDARARHPDNTSLLRRLAHLYEGQKQFSEALALWQRIRKVDPNDLEAPRKINDLAASETIARARRYRS